MQVARGGELSRATAVGVDPGYRDIVNVPLLPGSRWFDDRDMEQELPVCVIGPRVQEDLFPEGDWLGAEIQLVFTRNAGEDTVVRRITVVGALGEEPLAGDVWPALVSESFATRYRLGRGDELQLPTPTGERRVRVMGVYADYGNERGTLLMDGVRVSEWFDDLRAVNLTATLKPGVEPAAVRERWAADFPGLAVRTNRTLREEVLTIFHQTFAVTHALKAIGVAVAIGGLALALFSLLLDRREELVVLRELGFQRRGIMAAVTAEGLAMSVIGLAGGLILSLGLGYLLIYVINKQSFGWTLAYAVPVGGLALLAAGVLLAALLTSLGVGRWAARLKGEKYE